MIALPESRHDLRLMTVAVPKLSFSTEHRLQIAVTLLYRVQVSHVYWLATHSW